MSFSSSSSFKSLEFLCFPPSWLDEAGCYSWIKRPFSTYLFCVYVSNTADWTGKQEEEPSFSSPLRVVNERLKWVIERQGKRERMKVTGAWSLFFFFLLLFPSIATDDELVVVAAAVKMCVHMSTLRYNGHNVDNVGESHSLPLFERGERDVRQKKRSLHSLRFFHQELYWNMCLYWWYIYFYPVHTFAVKMRVENVKIFQWKRVEVYVTWIFFSFQFLFFSLPLLFSSFCTECDLWIYIFIILYICMQRFVMNESHTHIQTIRINMCMPVCPWTHTHTWKWWSWCWWWWW